jgi:hypothetical protein
MRKRNWTRDPDEPRLFTIGEMLVCGAGVVLLLFIALVL